jgi:predicted outer membrane protein
MSNTTLILALVATPCVLGACATNEQRSPAETPVSVRPSPAQPAAATCVPAAGAAPQGCLAAEGVPQPDRDFLRQAVSVNQAAIRFGQLAANNGASIEVRSLGREMVDTHTALADQIRTSAQTENIALPQAQMTPRMQRMYDELASLSGPQFDETFVRHVMTLQQETLASFENEATNGKLSELAMLADETLPLINQRARTLRNQMRHAARNEVPRM